MASADRRADPHRMIVAGIIAYLLDPVVRLLEKRGLSRLWSVVTVFLASLLAMVLLAGAVMMFAGVLQHIRERNVEWRIAGLFAVTAIPCSYVAADYSDAISEVVPLRMLIGGVILLSTVLLFYRYVIMKPKPRELLHSRHDLHPPQSHHIQTP